MNTSDWAKNEVRIACERERAAGGEMCGYGVACYESALKAFESLMSDGHSGYSISITKHILMRLIDGRPLTPITDDENEEWWFRWEKDGVKTYQCKRMSSLFKYVKPDGTVTYSDTDRVVTVDMDNGSTWSNGFIDRLINERYPITLPYSGGEEFKVYRRDFLFDEANGDYDTFSLEYVIKPDGVREELQEYYKEDGDSFVKISKDEYEDRYKKYLLRVGSQK